MSADIPYHPPVKRSIAIEGHRTSISLEPVFWDMLKDAAEDAGRNVQGGPSPVPIGEEAVGVGAERAERAESAAEANGKGGRQHMAFREAGGLLAA